MRRLRVPVSINLSRASASSFSIGVPARPLAVCLLAVRLELTLPIYVPFCPEAAAGPPRKCFTHEQVERYGYDVKKVDSVQWLYDKLPITRIVAKLLTNIYQWRASRA